MGERSDERRRVERVHERIGRKADRKLEARREPKRGLWFGLGMFGLVGWSVAIPTLVGVAVGVWLDDTLDGRVSWTLTLLFVGVVLGCLNAWWWVRREGGHD
jgi:ATP synthase protein I